MILQASNGCYLTENFEVAIKDRRFINSIMVENGEEASLWREVTDTERKKMLEEGAFFEPDDISYDYLNKVDNLIAQITVNINSASLSTEQALDKMSYFPAWSDLIGQQATIGFRFRYNDILYEVIQTHTFADNWTPGVGTESLYKVVQVEASGTIDDPIEWVPNMELFNGQYYTEDNILYKCTRDSGIPLSYKLSELVGLYVEVENSGTVDSDTTESIDGTLDNPIQYIKGETYLEKDKYYSENGIIYLCIQTAGVQVYDLSIIPAIAQKIN